jgi:flagellar motility protein MotE (MotC chaperone)
LLLGIAFALACSGPQSALASEGDAPAAATSSTPRQLHYPEKKPRPANRKKLTAMRSEGASASRAVADIEPNVATHQKLPAAPEHLTEAREATKHETASERKAAPVPHEIQQFCSNIANSAADARVAWQAARLIELNAKLKRRIAEFDVKRAEFEDWLHKHDEAMKQAKDDIVAIYSKMRPDAAASQLAVMNDDMAASLLAKLNARVASAILAEMDPGRAARIANAMAGPVNPSDGKKS